NSAGVAISFGTRIEISVLIVQYLPIKVWFTSFYLVLLDSIFDASRYYDPIFDTSTGLKNDTGKGWREYRGKRGYP
ncbi:hypothetical protein, partial [Salmonella enterica]|uniref:hypothetical protein n=1 Tax=Salmonella enterica TaxID=28901 RepID=UPI003730C304